MDTDNQGFQFFDNYTDDYNHFGKEHEMNLKIRVPKFAIPSAYKQLWFSYILKLGGGDLAQYEIVVLYLFAEKHKSVKISFSSEVFITKP